MSTIKTLEEIATIAAGDSVVIVRQDGTGHPEGPCIVRVVDRDGVLNVSRGMSRTLYDPRHGTNWQTVTRIATRAEVEAWQAARDAKETAINETAVKKAALLARIATLVPRIDFAFEVEQLEQLADLLQESIETGCCMVPLGKSAEQESS